MAFVSHSFSRSWSSKTCCNSASSRAVYMIKRLSTRSNWAFLLKFIHALYICPSSYSDFSSDHRKILIEIIKISSDLILHVWLSPKQNLSAITLHHHILHFFILMAPLRLIHLQTWPARLDLPENLTLGDSGSVPFCPIIIKVFLSSIKNVHGACHALAGSSSQIAYWADGLWCLGSSKTRHVTSQKY